MTSPLHTGVAAALGAAALFGLSTPLAKGLLATVPPQLLGGLFYLGSGLGLSAVAVRRAPLARSQAGWLALAVLCGGVLAPPLQLLGVRLAPASTASLLLNLEGVFTALLAWTLFREHVNRRTAAGMLLIVAGGLVLGWSGFEWRGAGGPLAIAAACLLWGLDNNATQRVSGQDAVRIAALKGLVAGAVNTALALASGASLPSAAPLVRALAIGFACYGLSLVLFVRALRELGTARTGAYFSLAPFVGAAAGLYLHGEPFTAQLAAATTLMAGGLWLHLTEHHEHEHEHGPQDFEHTRHHGPHRHSHPHFPDQFHRHGHE